MYPYILACHIKTQQLCRHFIFDPMPDGFVKIVWYKRRCGNLLRPYKYYPYDPETGELKNEYWSAPRDTDIIALEKYASTKSAE